MRENPLLFTEPWEPLSRWERDDSRDVARSGELADDVAHLRVTQFSTQRRDDADLMPNGMLVTVTKTTDAERFVVAVALRQMPMLRVQVGNLLFDLTPREAEKLRRELDIAIRQQQDLGVTA